MSLKAYDGMMTRKGFEHLYDNMKSHAEEFRELAEQHLTKSYVEVVVDFIDNGCNPIDTFKFHSLHEKKVSSEIEELKTDIPLIRVLQAGSVMLSRAVYLNPFFVQLSLSIERKDDKLLIYPNLAGVKGYKELLLTFLTDWYAQNQVDPPSNVSEEEWEERSEDWWGFGNDSNMKTNITLFESLNGGFNSVNRTFGKEKMTKAILEDLPTDEFRIYRKGRRMLLSKKMKEKREKEGDGKNVDVGGFMQLDSYYRTPEGVKEVDAFIISEKVSITPINEELLNTNLSELLKPNE